MPLTSVHILLTYACPYECDHCFLWCCPSSGGTMTLAQVKEVLRQVKQVPGVRRVYFEGGEPFLFHPLMVEGMRRARRNGLEVGTVTNAYWATGEEDASVWLRPLARLGISDLSVSSDQYHGEERQEERAQRAVRAAAKLGIPASILRVRAVDPPADWEAKGEGELYFHGRAAVKLAPKVAGGEWRCLTKCPEVGSGMERVHVDAYGNVQFCQGITIGNIWERPLKEIMDGFRPEEHPIIGPLERGGPPQIAREHGLRPSKRYADGCHLCYDMRCRLRKRGKLSETLLPDQAYGMH
jgi:hypothetical protein